MLSFTSPPGSVLPGGVPPTPSPNCLLKSMAEEGVLHICGGVALKCALHARRPWTQPAMSASVSTYWQSPIVTRLAHGAQYGLVSPMLLHDV